MYYSFVILIVNGLYYVSSQSCDKECPLENGEMICAFDAFNRIYKMFPSKCALERARECFKSDYIKTPLKFCIKSQVRRSRKMYGQSCPAFCPEHYRPVCGANEVRAYAYRTFNNGCFMDMLNCRGDEDIATYTEVPLEFCQRHLMKNIFNEKVIISNVKDYRDYN